MYLAVSFRQQDPPLLCLFQVGLKVFKEHRVFKELREDKVLKVT
jgi:hypothetical protein